MAGETWVILKDEENKAVEAAMNTIREECAGLRDEGYTTTPTDIERAAGVIYDMLKKRDKEIADSIAKSNEWHEAEKMRSREGGYE